MTVKSAVERIEEVFPGKGNLILKELDLAQKELSSASKILTGRASLSSIGSNFAWSLPSDFLQFQEIALYDVNNKPLYAGEYNLAFEIEFEKLYAKSLTSTPITYLPTAISSAYLHYLKKPGDLDFTDEFSIDEELHGGLVARAFQKMYEIYPVDIHTRDGIIKSQNFQAAGYFGNQYQDYLIKAKRLANRKKDTNGEVQFYAHAGKTELPKRTYDSVSSTSLIGVGSTYSKFVIVEAIEGEATGTVTGTIGFGTISCAISGNTITITSTASDFVDVFVQQTNDLVEYEITSATTMTFTAYTGWTKDKIMLAVI